MIEDHLARAVLSALMLLEHSSAEEIDRDVAGQGLENIAADLNRMSVDERREFVAVLKRIADEDGDPNYVFYLDDLPRRLNWQAGPDS